MLTNEKIEEKLKNNNLWYQTNNYFMCSISDFKYNIDAVTQNGKAKNRFLINCTENDILVIPINVANSYELLVDEIVYICSGDIAKISVSQKNYISTNLKVEQRDGTIFNIEVDLGFDGLQRKNIIKFVENFKNEGAQILYKELPFSRNTGVEYNTNSDISIAITLVFIIVFFLSFFASVLDSQISGALTIIAIIIVFVSVFIGLFVESIALNSKNKKSGKVNRDFNDMTQEQREEYRERINEDVITGDGPIESNDDNYGGIKRL